MSKTLNNSTGSAVALADVGVTVPASGSYTIPQTDYPLFAASSNVVTKVGDGTLIVNDGSSNLSISDGIDLIKGIFPAKIQLQDGSGGILAFQNVDGANLLPTSAVYSPKGIEVGKLLNVGFGAVVTSPAFPTIKPLGFYNVPAGKKLRLFGVMFKTQTPTTYLHIYQRKLLWKQNAVALATPGAPTLAARTILGSGLTLLATYRYKLVGVNAVGKTVGSAEAAITLTTTQNAVSLSWTALTGALYYEIHRTSAGGATGTQKVLASTEATTFIDVVPDASLGAVTIPGSNTTLGSSDGSAYGAGYAASSVIVDTLTNITTPTALDIVYKNIYGDLRYATVTPAAAAGSQVEIAIAGRSNPADNRRIPRADNSFFDVAINDVVAVGNLSVTGSLAIFGITSFFMTASYLANQWNTIIFEAALTVPAGEELAFGISSNAAVTTGVRNDVILLGSLE